MKILYVGIDPGESGGMAWFSKDTTQRTLAYNYMAYLGTDHFRLVADKLRTLATQHDETHITLEQVGASPLMSRSNAFTFGRNYGEWKGMIAALPRTKSFFLVGPAVWQTALGCQSQGSKSELFKAQKERNRMPGLANFQDISDAISIAEYCLLRA